MLSIEEFAEFTKKAAKGMAEGFDDPEDDWLPVVQAQTRDGAMMLVGFDPAFMDSDESKDQFVAAVQAMILEQDVASFSMVLSAWTSKAPKAAPGTNPEDYAGPRPSEDPEREEMLLVQTFDADSVRTDWAPIYRDGEQPPGVGEWETLDGQVMGRMVEPFRDALKVARNRAKEEG